MGRMTLLSHSSNKKSKNPSSITTTAVVAFPIAQVIPGCLYFTSFDIYDDIAAADNKNVPKNDAKTVYIDIDSHVHYDAFYDDFGPLNLAVLYRFCQFLQTLVLQHNNTTQQQLQKKRIFLYTSADPKCRVNAVYLVASYMIIYHQLTAEQAYVRLQCAEPPPFIGFRDAAIGPPSYLLHVQHVIKSIEKALKFKWLDFSRFDADEYEHFERVENGDLNWIVPGKLLSFCGPHDQSYVENGYPYHSPEVYFDYFRANNVSTIVRLNKKIYDAKRFTDAGFAHHDLFFIDGSTPTEDIVLRFLDIVDSTKGAIAVHCKAGLGRTGCMIACWMMKHYRLTAPQCMAWLRVCRPGSVIGPQQQFLIEKQAWCWNLGLVDGLWSTHRINGLESEEEEEEDNCQKMPKINGGFTSSKYNEKRSDHDDSTKHTSVVMEQETALNEAGQSQGDRLCEIKARAQLRQHRQQQAHGHDDAQTNNQQNTATPPLSSSSASKFVSPFDTQVMLPPDRTTTTTTTMSPMPSSLLKNNKNGIANCCYSSATTPIKQLKLSSTVGSSGHAPPAFVKINNSTLMASNQTHRRRPVSPKPFEKHHQHQQTQQQPQYDLEKQSKTLLATDARSTSNNSANNSKNNNNIFLDIITPIGNAKTATTTTSAKNPIAVINRLPIHKVSVSSTGRQQHSYQHYTAPSRAQLHRKHFSAAVARLKPYQASECETAHRFASELASTAHASAQHNYGKSLKKQYSAISAACLQQKRHKQQQQQQNQLMMTMMMMNNSCSTKGTLTVAASSSSAPWAVPAMDGGSGTPKCNENKNINTNNNNNIGHGTTTNCKYELRPRDQLNLPARFALEQPSSSSSLSPPNGTTNNNSNTGTSVPSNNNNNSPYLITRHQKASKSATAFFPTSSRL